MGSQISPLGWVGVYGLPDRTLGVGRGVCGQRLACRVVVQEAVRPDARLGMSSGGGQQGLRRLQPQQGE